MFRRGNSGWGVGRWRTNGTWMFNSGPLPAVFSFPCWSVYFFTSPFLFLSFLLSFFTAVRTDVRTWIKAIPCILIPPHDGIRDVVMHVQARTPPVTLSFGNKWTRVAGFIFKATLSTKKKIWKAEYDNVTLGRVHETIVVKKQRVLHILVCVCVYVGGWGFVSVRVRARV